MNTRRQFIRISAGIAAAGAPLAAAAPLPTARLGKYDITRLIIGSNPFYGYSHTSRTLDEHMREWSTPDNVCAALQEAGRNGINTFQTNGGDRAISDIRLHRERGGKLQVIALIKKNPEDAVASMRPIAVSHHGEVTDALFRQRKMDDVREFTKRVRQAGVLVGVSTHQPEIVEYIEEHGWDVDFYMGCVYNRTRTPEEIRKLLGQLPLPANEALSRKRPGAHVRRDASNAEDLPGLQDSGGGTRGGIARIARRGFQDRVCGHQTEGLRDRGRLSAVQE